MVSLDLALTLGGIAYGVILIVATFVNNKFIEAFRLDTLFMRNPSPNARGLNLVAGLAFIGYNVYTMLR